jgi:hypothetical protein
MTDEKDEKDEKKAEATPEEATDESAVDDAEQKRIWREGLLQEAVSNRPELRKLAGPKDYAASRRTGHDFGFEDAARKLTVDQLRGITALKDRRLARYVLRELPPDLQAYLSERSAGLDEAGFLAGYVDGVADFLSAYKERMSKTE